MKGLAALVAGAPPTVGYALIALVIFDPGASPSLKSPAVAVATLATAAILIVGSAFMYCRWPKGYVNFAKTFTGYRPDHY